MAFLSWLFGNGSGKAPGEVRVPEALKRLEERETVRRQAEAATRASKVRATLGAEGAPKTDQK